MSLCPDRQQRFSTASTLNCDLIPVESNGWTVDNLSALWRQRCLGCSAASSDTIDFIRQHETSHHQRHETTGTPTGHPHVGWAMQLLFPCPVGHGLDMLVHVPTGMTTKRREVYLGLVDCADHPSSTSSRCFVSSLTVGTPHSRAASNDRSRQRCCTGVARLPTTPMHPTILGPASGTTIRCAMVRKSRASRTDRLSQNRPKLAHK